ncbi:family 16 glycosylhydrolase [Neiella marina]|uniref:Family 16 glycosylhydrolase n=1 Tax=Neiella holothuriorum TaxID=2870530 RepID=A0ABS7EEF7_9GAMM|nr:glycoside hydrolase family 16 protein [Neiella holothuriorum]MBW8190604.1 family 16 glycosylhydrolase [Neiella holothuriorum]
MKNPRIKYLAGLVFSSLLAATSLSGCGSDPDTNYKEIDVSQPTDDWSLVWSDEFDGNSIDDDKWNHEVNCEGGGNNEKQCYTDSAENSYVADGYLHIVAQPAEDGAELPYTSARLTTQNIADWKYGRIEMRAKAPYGQGSWPAFWMMPSDSVYGGWPRSGEIDIFEAVNLKVSDDEGNVESSIYGTLHYGQAWPDNSHTGAEYVSPNGNPADDFHTYAIEWQEGEIRWYMDNYLYATQRASEPAYNADGEAYTLKHRGWFTQQYNPDGELETVWDASPFDQEFYLILNFAVGGDWPEYTNDTGIDEAAFAEGQSYIIDYVRVYECASGTDLGTGCETIRAGYDQYEDESDVGSLQVGEAPYPVIESDEAEDLVVWADSSYTDWSPWDCCGGTVPTVEIDDDAYGEVIEFVINNNDGTVMGFSARSDAGGAQEMYDGTAAEATGTFSFDMKVVDAPTDAEATWSFKVESNNADTAAAFSLNESAEGLDPVVGQWQTYTFSYQQMSEAGLDLSAIDVVMVYPSWGKGADAVYRIDNVEFNTNMGSAELIIYEEEENAAWPAWDCCGGTTPNQEVDDDADHNNTIEFTIGETATVVGFNSKISDDPDTAKFDASSIVDEGVVTFDIKVIDAPLDSSAVWTFKIESNDADSAVELAFTESAEGVVPETGEWQTYTFPLASLADLGLDVSAIDVIMVFPNWGAGNGAVFRIDNMKIYDPTASSPSSSTLDLFVDTVADSWTTWDCCAGSTPAEVEADEAEYGTVAQFEIGSTSTVVGFLADDGVYFDASSIVSDGYVQFEMKVLSMPIDSSAAWKFKIESGDAATAVELDLNASVEGADPADGVWQTYTFMLSDLLSAGLDVANIDVVMIFPAWGSGEGAKFQIDNAVIAND